MKGGPMRGEIIFVILLWLCSLKNVSSFPEIIIQAKCHASCMEKFGGLYTKLSRAGKSYSSYRCLDDCKDCLSACDVQLPNIDLCFELCERIKNGTTCRAGCEVHYSLKDKAAQRQEMFVRSSLIAKVDAVCMTLQGSFENPSILASFIVKVNSSFLKPAVLVIFIRQKIQNVENGVSVNDNNFRITDWHPLGIRTDPMFSLHKLLPGTEYQLKALSIDADSISTEASDITWIKTLTGDVVLKPPVIVSVDRQFVMEGKLQAEVTWVPDKSYPNCFYHLIWRNDLTTESKTFPVEDSFGYILTNLNYSLPYTVLIRSVSSLKIPRLESSLISTVFQTWSCLEANRFHFKICEPGSVINLTASVNNASATVKWQRPMYVTVSNQLSHYSCRWRSLPHLGRCLKHVDVRFNISSNATTWNAENMGKNCFYLFEISAVSLGGISQMKSVTFDYSVPDSFDTENYEGFSFQPAYFVLLPITVGLIIVGVLVALRLRPKQYDKPRMAHTVNTSLLRQILRNYANQFYEPSEPGALSNVGVEDLSPFITEVEDLGSGHFGSVWKANSTAPGLPSVVAVKKLKKHCFHLLENNDECEKHLLNEVEMMKEKIANHPNVVGFYGICLKPELKVVMEFCTEGSLKVYLNEIRETLLAKPQASPGADSGYDQTPEYDAAEFPCTSTRIQTVGGLVDSSQLLSYGRQIAAGMQHMSNQNLVHRDLAARNVLVTARGKVVKISDFGLTREGGIYYQTNKDAVPLAWLAPESLTGRFTSLSDVWSFGIVLWELATIGGEPGATGYTRDELIIQYRSGFRLPKPQNCSEHLYKIMTACWSYDETLRPNFGNLKEILENLLESNEEYLSLDIDADSVYYHSQ